jgi:ribonuclease HII
LATIGSLFGELYRLGLMSRLEDSLALAGFSRVAGVDEAGRGCLAGPVVAAAVLPDPRRPIPGIDDSKRLTARAREELAERIRATARSWAVASVPAAGIDASHILAATRVASIEALRRLAPRPDAVVTDALPLPGLGLPQLPVVKADAWCYAVACASILAKVERDRIMQGLHLQYPQYGFDRHKGYPTANHLQLLAELGPCEVHRRSFAPVRALL